MKNLLGLISILMVVLLFMSPIYFMIHYDNPWYMFLFLVSWIPAVGGKIFISIFES